MAGASERKQTIRVVAAVLPTSPGVFPVNTTTELLHAKQGSTQFLSWHHTIHHRANWEGSLKTFT